MHCVLDAGYVTRRRARSQGKHAGVSEALLAQHQNEFAPSLSSSMLSQTVSRIGLGLPQLRQCSILPGRAVSSTPRRVALPQPPYPVPFCRLPAARRLYR